MKLRALRFNLHHLALAGVLVLIGGMVWGGWPAIPATLGVLVLVALISDGIARPASGLFYPTILHGPRDSGCVALSFDDGPDALVTPKVLDALAANDARATFFVIGQALAAHPELARRMLAEGHALGNHSWRHSRLQTFRFRKWHRAEIQRCEQALTAVAGSARHGLYRPPMGQKIGELCRELWRERLTLVAWSLHSHDTRLADPQQIARRVLTRARGGDIILLHDGHDRPGRHRSCCPETVELILRGLHKKGLTCVTVPELLGQGNTVKRNINGHIRSVIDIRTCPRSHGL
jgi:peptidoglycan/xylan/chitin deacetylase (PgdA/CDA1 family)